MATATEPIIDLRSTSKSIPPPSTLLSPSIPNSSFITGKRYTQYNIFTGTDDGKLVKTAHWFCSYKKLEVNKLVNAQDVVHYKICSAICDHIQKGMPDEPQNVEFWVAGSVYVMVVLDVYHDSTRPLDTSPIYVVYLHNKTKDEHFLMVYYCVKVHSLRRNEPIDPALNFKTISKFTEIDTIIMIEQSFNKSMHLINLPLESKLVTFDRLSSTVFRLKTI